MHTMLPKEKDYILHSKQSMHPTWILPSSTHIFELPFHFIVSPRVGLAGYVVKYRDR